MKREIQGQELASLYVDNIGLVTPGMSVAHPVFGRGTVVQIFVFPHGGHALRVEFASAGSVALVPEHAQLRKIKPDM